MKKDTDCINPFERIREIEEKLNILEKEELELKEQIRKKINKSNNQNRLNECESEQLFLIIENNCMQTAINWFEIYVLGYRKAEDIYNSHQRQLRKQNPLDFQFSESVDTNGQSLVGTANIRDKNSHFDDNILIEEELGNRKQENVGDNQEVGK
jgi:hypothetical protein